MTRSELRLQTSQEQLPQIKKPIEELWSYMYDPRKTALKIKVSTWERTKNVDLTSKNAE